MYKRQILRRSGLLLSPTCCRSELQHPVSPQKGRFLAGQRTVSYTHLDVYKRQYRNNDFFGLVAGLNFAAQYQGKNDRTDVTEANCDGFGFSTTYEYEGFGVGATYAKSDRTDGQVAYGKSLSLIHI